MNKYINSFLSFIKMKIIYHHEYGENVNELS